MNNTFSPLDLVGLIVVAIAFVKILGPIGQAIAHRMRGSERSPDAAILAEIDGLKDRLAEVEERLDFSERLLANSRQAEQLPGRLQQ
jgi:hypothetical protein